MDSTRIAKWLNDIQGWLDPPGCETEFTAQPGGESNCCTVGIVHEHRFAFYYWALYASQRDEHKPLPALITLDSHDDVGVSGDVDVDDLDTLHLSNRTELGLFAWTRLRRLNDGHILPALYLNFFSDVYVLMNSEEDREEFESSYEEQQLKDRYGNVHAVKYYQHVDQLMQNLPPDIPVFLDIDLDFFAVDNPTKDRLGSEILRPDDFIKSFMSIDGQFFGPILKRTVGLTIALEPKYCGGLLNSLRVLDILNRELFDGTLCTDDCKWRLP